MVKLADHDDSGRGLFVPNFRYAARPASPASESSMVEGSGVGVGSSLDEELVYGIMKFWAFPLPAGLTVGLTAME